MDSICVGAAPQICSTLKDRPEFRNALLAMLAAEGAQHIRPYLAPVRLPRGMVLLEPGQDPKHVYFPHDSVISMTSILHDGGAVGVVAIGHDGMTGFTAALGARRTLHRHTVQVSGDATRLAMTQLEAAFAAAPILRNLCLRYTEALLGEVMQSVACNARHSAEARLSRWLLMLHDRVGGGQLRLTQDFLAELLGVRRATVSLAAQKLQVAGLIRCRRGLVEIADRPGLQASSCECYLAVARISMNTTPIHCSGPATNLPASSRTPNGCISYAETRI